VVTVFPFVWVVSTSVKGPEDAVYSVPPQLIPQNPTLANYQRVWQTLPVGRFFMNSLVVATGTVTLNLLFTSLAAYPLAKMKFPGRDLIFYLLLATFIVPPQLTYIPSYVLAVNVFRFYDTLLALIFPSLATVFNIFLLRQSFRAVPDDIIDAARLDGARELRIWWSVLMPLLKPSLATAAIITFVTQWNDFLWPSLMLHTRERMTLQVGLVAMQGMFTSDSRGMAAGVVMTIIPILILFIVLQRQFVRGLAGAVKG
jgi:putative chitobiose transport system permease protein